MAARHVPEQDDFGPEPRSIDLREYWLVVRRRWMTVVVATVIGAIGGLGYAHSTAPTYSATSQVLVSPVTQGPLNLPAQVSNLVNMSTEQSIAQSAPVVQQAARLLHVPGSVLQAESAKRLTVAVPTTSDVLQITWTGASPRSAQRGANAFGRAYLSYRHSYLAGTIAVLNTTLTNQAASLRQRIDKAYQQLNGATGSALRQSLNTTLVQLNSQLGTASAQLESLPTYNDSGGQVILSPLPLAPSGLGRKVILAMGALIGLLIGLALAFGRDAFDDRIRDSAQLERKLGVPTLAILPSADSRKQVRDGGQWRQGPELSTVANPDGRSAEAVRALRATLVAMAARRNVRTVLVVGADATVSSSRMAAELGVALAESGRHVLLIAADMRGSSLAQIFDIPNGTGLGDLLVSGGDPEALSRQPKRVGGVALPTAVVKRLAVLPSGSQAAAALSIVDSGAMVKLLNGRREAYEFVLLDSPPATVASDIIALATHVDGLIVIAREGSTRGRAAGDLRRRLDQVGAELIGGVLIGKARGGRHRSAGSRPASPATVSTELRERDAPADRIPPTAARVVPDGLESKVSDRGAPARRSL